MPIKIEIPDSQLPAARQLYAGIAKEKWEQLNNIQKEWAELIPILEKLGVDIPGGPALVVRHSIARMVSSTIDINGYDKNWSWGKKATYVLLKEGPLTAKKIVDRLVDIYEPSVNAQLAYNNIPSTLSVASRKGKYKRIEKNGDFIYDIEEKDQAIKDFINQSDME